MSPSGPMARRRGPRAVRNVVGAVALLLVLALVATLLYATVRLSVGGHKAAPTVVTQGEARGEELTDEALACVKCHNVLTDDGYLSQSVVFSHVQHVESVAHCQECHDGGDVETHGYVTETATDLCLLCHQDQFVAANCLYCHTYDQATMPEDHTAADWPTTHGSASTSYVSSHDVSPTCMECHKTELFCLECHRLPMPHPAGFASDHRAAAWNARGDCAYCHDSSECDACHHSQEPESHKTDPFIHWDPDLLSSSRCATCHTGSTYCAACHEGAKPDDHVEGWDHGDAALEVDANCGFCHDETGYCLDCHGLEMPHHNGFFGVHSSQDQSLCGVCHTDKSECIACHQNVYPETHRVDTWLADHRTTADEEASCEICHGAPGCSACHGGLQLPHPDRFLITHGVNASEKPGMCSQCHTQDECMACHNLAIPLKPADHTDSYLVDHATLAKDRRPYCEDCHSKADTCNTDCHDALGTPIG